MPPLGFFDTAMRAPEDNDVIVDWKNAVARATLAKSYGPELTTRDGLASGPIFRLFRMLHAARKQYGGRLILCFEGGEQKRYDWHAGYKASRRQIEPVAGGARDQIAQYEPILRSMVQHMKCVLVTPSAAEADDAILSWVKDHPKRSHVVLSTDKDLWYLLKYPHVTVLGLKGGEPVTLEKVRDTFGVKPSRIPLMKALFGDTADCIPKVPRLGRGDAEDKNRPALAQLAEQATSAEHFIKLVATKKSADAAGLHPKIREQILAHTEQFKRMVRVAKLRHVGYTKVLRSGHGDKLRGLLQSYECTSLLPHVDLMVT